MLQIIKTLLIIASIIVLSASEGYQDYKIYDVIPLTHKQCDLLHELSKRHNSYDFFTLSRLPQHLSRIMIPPHEEDNLLRFFRENEMTFELIENNVGKTIEQEFLANQFARSLMPLALMGKEGRLNTDRFYRHAEINSYIENLAARYPDRITVETKGQSYEKRDMKTITVTNGDGRSNKSVILVDGGFHALENSSHNADLLLDHDWIILPVANPDGYEYTHRSFLTRLWRKTRQPHRTIFGIKCHGADPNRNFGFHWNEAGSPPIPCFDIYAGPRAFSEPETQIERDLIDSQSGRGVMYLTLHSFGNYLLYPWGWTSKVSAFLYYFLSLICISPSDLPDTWRDLDEVTRAGADAIRNATGTVYTVGSSTNVLYIAAGASEDYAFNSGFLISITMELPGGGITGFAPPVSKIDPYVKEAWIGIRAMAKKVVEKYPK